MQLQARSLTAPPLCVSTELFCDRAWRKALKRWTPTITIGFARRHLDLDTRWRWQEAW